MIRKLASLDRLPDLIEQGIVLSISLIFLALYLVVMATMMHLNNPKNDSFPQSLYFYVITMTTVGECSVLKWINCVCLAIISPRRYVFVVNLDI